MPASRVLPAFFPVLVLAVSACLLQGSHAQQSPAPQNPLVHVSAPPPDALELATVPQRVCQRCPRPAEPFCS